MAEKNASAQQELREQAVAEAARLNVALSARAAEVQSLETQRALELVKVKLDLNHATATQLQVTVPSYATHTHTHTGARALACS
jgi:hypothetical protein